MKFPFPRQHRTPALHVELCLLHLNIVICTFTTDVTVWLHTNILLDHLPLQRSMYA